MILNLINCERWTNSQVCIAFLNVTNQGREVVQREHVCVSKVGDHEIDCLHQLVPFTLAMLTIHSLTAFHQLASASAADWFNKGCAMCYHVYVIMHVKDP